MLSPKLYITSMLIFLITILLIWSPAYKCF